MVEHGILSEKQIFGWRCCYGEEFPSEDTNQAVVFNSFYEKDSCCPRGPFSAGFFISMGSR